LEVPVFTAGIGEHAAEVRERICWNLDVMGLKLDAPRNRENAPVISEKHSKVKVRVIKTNEELMIARHTARLSHRNLSRKGIWL
jgi:acetate kinase